jgi:hypothetical protein
VASLLGPDRCALPMRFAEGKMAFLPRQRAGLKPIELLKAANERSDCRSRRYSNG